MTRLIIDPGQDIFTRIADIPTSKRIPHFQTRLLFFDEFVILGENRPSSVIQIGSPIRELQVGPDVDFLSRHKRLFLSAAPPDRSLWEATKIARDCYTEGKIFSDDLMISTEDIGE